MLRSSLTLKGSNFFRGNDWDFFRDESLSSFKGRDHVCVWCAGCSFSGQEAYSTILCLLDQVPLDAIDVLATDYDDELHGRLAASLAKDDYLFVFNDDHTDNHERILQPAELGLVEMGHKSIYRRL